jgi:hypothetical protein
MLRYFTNGWSVIEIFPLDTVLFLFNRHICPSVPVRYFDFAR